MLTSILTMTILSAEFNYPPTKTVPHTDTYHGITVADPYRWLEQPATTPEVKSWIESQNKLTNSYLENIPNRDVLQKELEKRINFERLSAPTKRGEKVFYSRNSGLQNQDVLYVVDKPGAEPRVLLDPNTLSTDGTIALSGQDISLNGKFLLYGLASAGSDWLEWKVKDTTTGKDVGEAVKWSKFGGGTINADGTAFYYLRYPAPKEGEDFTATNTNPAIYKHTVGTSQDKDEKIFDLPNNPDWFLFPILDAKKETLFLYVSSPSSTNNRLYLQELTSPNAPIIKVFDAEDANYSPIHRQGSEIWIQTTKDAPKNKIIKFNYLQDVAPVTIVPQSEDPIEGASVIGGKLVVNYLKDAASAVKIYTLDGKLEKEVELPTIGSASGFSGEPDDNEAYFSFSGFTFPNTIYKYDINTHKNEVYKSPQLPINPDNFEAKQVFVPSKDGTKIPMTMVYRKGTKMDGTNPTLLYAYGGFNVSNTPWFSTSRTAFMDMGGVWVLANIRGGGEYGKEWHEAAIKTKRQNAYDDFIACAEYLIETKVTNPNRLAIQGGSNGGLLIGVASNQRPDLFQVAIPEVGVMDMLRFNKFTIGAAWEADYGSPENEAEFFALLRISPYHNLTPGTNYPATLVTTADTDDRVVPAHSFKYAARLQACQADPNSPTLIRIETSAGHGGGKPITKVLEEVTDVYAFILKNMGINLPKSFK